MFKILAIETSCDDTSAAIIDNNFKIYANIISSQSIHKKYGGVVPELASREHIKAIIPIVDTTFEKAGLKLSEIEAIAVSVNPGLIGSLLVGLSFAKGLAYSIDKPFIAVNHIMGHVFANFIEHKNLDFPFLALIVSGGHTELVFFGHYSKYKVLGRTVDDAAGEAFDKIGKILGLPYPGGPYIDKLAKMGIKGKIDFPLPMRYKQNYDFSFSGLKTAAALFIKNNKVKKKDRNFYNLLASFQNAIIHHLFLKTIKALEDHSIKNLVLAGGVAANTELRQIFSDYAKEKGINLYYPSPPLCTDNAAMIGAAAIFKYKNKDFANFDLNASPLKGIRKI